MKEGLLVRLEDNESTDESSSFPDSVSPSYTGKYPVSSKMLVMASSKYGWRFITAIRRRGAPDAINAVMPSGSSTAHIPSHMRCKGTGAHVLNPQTADSRQQTADSRQQTADKKMSVAERERDRRGDRGREKE